ncbi:MAG: phosphoadenosine phosphosulfate reductase [Limimaricola sp.]|uniref:phosphoadenosine phosphosulfate reductase n=1 Tax=Limimaricola sp. TaxID=2211665 RepID=UPI001DF3D124|nr:phosphoadenosine phosphosulfate reductase [Limimaricola sp.]MBI1418448.1 phosphoadenosine phosphosulfate reductase [Limimaricola sp.]
MNDTRIDLDRSLADLDGETWIAALDQLAEEHGSFSVLGADHVASFIDAGPRLLVTFESQPRILAHNQGDEPLGFEFVRRHGWSHLAIIGRADGWFRDPAIYQHFDRLIDDGFFEDFESVLFYGADGGAYAACAYAVAAPGCRVLAVRPQATLDPELAGWDPRYARHRRLNFTDRFGYAPDMLEAVQSAHIVFDPAEQLDAMHAALFAQPNVTLLRCRRLGPRLDQALAGMRVLAPSMLAAMEGRLDQLSFARLMRARAHYMPYARHLLAVTEVEERPLLSARICQHVLRQGDKPFFAQKLAKLKAAGHVPPAAPRPALPAEPSLADPAE